MESGFASGDFEVTRKLERLLAQAKQARVPKVMPRVQGLRLSLAGMTTGTIAHPPHHHALLHRRQTPLPPNSNSTENSEEPA